ncbi:beta-mannosidase [Sphingomonas lenta]|uniref:Beta-mannosidase B n=1 Tax=Sphingomonas lenta TaxID=1141887 RepID=A0A2A2SIT4_9SPHN|nr:sugar-binding domain-containing protein [Sphingomonas lenta]PAX09070.1 glycoside hydrolase [Sphingomonas lenta]
MLRIDLNGDGWTFGEAGSAERSPGRVPGCVHTDLLAAGRIADPFWADNETALQWIEERDWTYVRTFTVDDELLARDQVQLVLDGLDTVAEVWVNGAVALSSDNMFHRHRVDVRDLLRAGKNEIEVRFESAMRRVREVARSFRPPREFNDPVGGCVGIRKEQCQFGWDWGPRFVTAGLWRPAAIEAWNGARIAGVRVAQRHEAGRVRIALHPELDRLDPGARFRATLSLDDLVVAEAEGSELELNVADPRLWWPAGQGDQPLYEVVVSLQGAETPAWRRRIGLRTVSLDMDSDGAEVAAEDGRSIGRFGFRVNGRLVFAKGANWIPAHSFVAGLGRTELEPLVRAAADAHMNMLRVWGGGVYEDDAFFDLCDELGLLVWQDFMFACTLYPGDDAFVASVRREAEDQVRRLRHHPSLALWCGNNEIVLLNREALAEPEHGENYRRVFLDALPGAVSALSPETPYIHSSPLMTPPGREPAPSEDAHDWEVWARRAPVEHLGTTRHRFLSEFGMQSYPSVELARSFCPEEELNIGSPVFDSHQKFRNGNGVVLDYVGQRYRFPRDYASLAYLSQLHQAWAVGAAVEHCRRSSPTTLGALYWQLNDCWPVASWSSLEFGGGWKALHHHARRFFAPTLLSLRQLGGERRIIGNYRENDSGLVELHVAHDGPGPLRGRIDWRLIDFAGERLEGGTLEVAMNAGSSRMLDVLDLRGSVERIGRDRTVLRAELFVGGRRACEATGFFAPPRSLRLARAPIEVTRDGDMLSVRSETFQHAVHLGQPGDRRWSLDWFDLFPGEERLISLLDHLGRPAALPGEVTPMSLVDSYS